VEYTPHWATSERVGLVLQLPGLVLQLPGLVPGLVLQLPGLVPECPLPGA
jgi:hypothetical protein